MLLATTIMDLNLHYPSGVRIWVRAHILQNLMNPVQHLLERQVLVGLVRFGGRYECVDNDISRVRVNIENVGVHTGKKYRRVRHLRHPYRKDPREYLCR